MAWTEITRRQYRRDDLAYASDLRDREWTLLAPLMPPPKRYGRPRRTERRRVGEAVLYIVKRSNRAQGFVLLPKRWIVERTFAWLGRCRRLNRDVEATLQASQAWLIVAHIRRMLRKITQTAF